MKVTGLEQLKYFFNKLKTVFATKKELPKTATSSTTGLVKPDDKTIKIDDDGTLSVAATPAMETPKIDRESTVNSPGTFTFGVTSGPDAEYMPVKNQDWAVLQVDTGNDAFQITASGGHLYIRQCDSVSGNTALSVQGATIDDWTSWERIANVSDLS